MRTSINIFTTPLKVNLFDLSTKTSVGTRLVKKLTDAVMNCEKADISELNIIIAGDAYLRKLNKTYLNKDSCTNVIAFSMEEISEIYVSYEQAKSQEELLYFIVHGLLHIIGYEHESPDQDEAMHKKCLDYVKNSVPEQKL